MASRSSQYRQKIKETDPEKYQTYLNNQRVKSKESRDKQKRELAKRKVPEEVVKQKEKRLSLQRERQKKYLERKKNARVSTETCERNENILIVKLTTKDKHLTKKQINSKREYNRIAKQRERAKMSHQKKTWIKKKDCQRKARSRQRDKEMKRIETPIPLNKSEMNKTTEEQPSISKDDNGELCDGEKEGDNDTCLLSPFSSKKREWNITSKVRAAIPTTPEKFATVMNNLIENSTPKRKKALRKIIDRKDTCFDKQSLLKLKSTNKGKRAITEFAKTLSEKYKNTSLLSKTLHLNRRTVMKAVTGKQKKTSSKIDEKTVKRFYFRHDVSRVLPQKRYATKLGAGYLMQVSVAAAYSKFRKENPSKQISKSKFASLRPKNVRLLSVVHREYCECIYCVNVRYKLLTLSRYMSDKAKKFHNEQEILQILLCPKGDSERFHSVDCLSGKCKKCSDYTSTLKQFYLELDEKQNMTWNRWEKFVDGNGFSKKIVVTKSGCKHDIINELVNEDILKPSQGTTFLRHIHTANWQNMQFSNIKNNLPDGWILQVMDFAKNRDIKYQDEIKAAFFTNQQVTLHPIVTYYRGENSSLVKESNIVISEDNNHDYHAVAHFENLVDLHIADRLNKKPQHKIVFSDGCSAQYKSKGPFADLSLQSSLRINRNFFGSEHGKSDCDAEIGILNRNVDRAIIGRQVVINNAEELFNFCKKNLELDDIFVKRTFFFVRRNEINRERPHTDVKTVPKTRQIHQLTNTDKQYNLQSRNLSCFCQFCSAGTGECLNKNYVTTFNQISLVPCASVSTKKKIKSKTMASLDGRKIKKPKSVYNDCKQALHDNDVCNNNELNEDKSLTSDVPTNGIEGVDHVYRIERHTFFKDALKSFNKCKDFYELQEECLVIKSNIDKYAISVKNDLNILEGNDSIDRIALSLMPSYLTTELQGKKMPINIVGDGNCLPRSGSKLAFGNEIEHEEIRTRIIVEMALNEQMYTQNSFLNRGAQFTSKEAKHISKTYAMFSEKYVPNDVLTHAVIRRLFQQEVVDSCKLGTYMSIWHLHALSSVLNTTIHSVYPDRGDNVPRLHLNRKILPRFEQDNANNFVYIMWTSNRNDMTNHNWIPNHFIPLLNIKPLEKEKDTEIIMEFDDWSDIVDDKAIIDAIQSALFTTQNYDNKVDLVDGSRAESDAFIVNMLEDMTNEKDVNKVDMVEGMKAEQEDNIVDMVESTHDERNNNIGDILEITKDKQNIYTEDMMESTKDENNDITEGSQDEKHNTADVVEDRTDQNDDIIGGRVEVINDINGDMMEGAEDDMEDGMEDKRDEEDVYINYILEGTEDQKDDYVGDMVKGTKNETNIKTVNLVEDTKCKNHDIIGDMVEVTKDENDDMLEDAKDEEDVYIRDLFRGKKDQKDDDIRDMLEGTKDQNDVNIRDMLDGKKDQKDDDIRNMLEGKKDQKNDNIGDILEGKMDQKDDDIGNMLEGKMDQKDSDIGDMLEGKKDQKDDGIGDMLEGKKDQKDDNIGDMLEGKKDQKNDDIKDMFDGKKEQKDDDIEDMLEDKKDQKDDDIGNMLECKMDQKDSDIGNMLKGKMDQKDDDIEDMLEGKKDQKDDDIEEMLEGKKDQKDDDIGDILEGKMDQKDDDIGNMLEGKMDQKDSDIGDMLEGKMDQKDDDIEDMLEGKKDQKDDDIGDKLEGKKDQKNDDIGEMVDDMKLQQNPESYKKGEYILVSHGSKNYPAVVTSWPSIRYFTNKKKSKDWWVVNDICFEIEEEDVLGKIQNPEIVKCGQHRIFYVFHDLDVVLTGC